MDKRKAFIFLLTIYILVSAIGISTYIKQKTPLTGMTTSPQGTVNLTIELGNDITPPSVAIISPTGTVTNITSISVRITFTDNQAFGTCWYNVTDSNNAIAGSAFRQLICSSGRDSLNVSSAGTYTIHAYANDSSGNKNFTTQGNFMAQAAAETIAAETTASKPVIGHGAFRVQSESSTISFTARGGGEKSFSLLNLADKEKSFRVYLIGFENVLELSEQEFTIPARTEYKIRLINIGDEPGEYSGEIVIESDNLEKRVAIAVSVSENQDDAGMVFDYPSIYKEVCAGCEIGFSINFESSEKNAKAVYTIKDFEDNVLYRKNEIINVNDLPYNKVIKLPESMEEGQYVLFIAVNTGGKTQIASHIFNIVKAEVHEEKPAIGSSVTMVIILLVLIIVNLIMLHKTRL